MKHARRNAVAYIALAFSLGSTTYAATQLPRGSVGTRQLRNEAVTTAKVRPGTLRANDFAGGVLPGNIEFAVRSEPAPVSPGGGPVAARPRCEPGEVAFGGGYGYSGMTPADALARMRTVADVPVVVDGVPVGWEVVVQEQSGGGTPTSPTVYVICAKLG